MCSRRSSRRQHLGEDRNGSLPDNIHLDRISSLLDDIHLDRISSQPDDIHLDRISSLPDDIHLDRISSLPDDIHLDRISSLPDDILLSIMSLLTFKDVIKTSLISRRWLDLWVHTPLQTLLNFYSYPDLDDREMERERRKYIKWVNHVLRLNNGLYLKEFKILFDLDNSDRKTINKWLVFALERRVERLELSLLLPGIHVDKINGNYVFPSRFLNRFPQFDLKCLKSLSLRSVDVTGDVVNFILIDCPFLERLEVSGTRKLVNLVLSDTRRLVLKYLKIKDCIQLKVTSITKVNHLVSMDIPCINVLTLYDVPSLVELTLSRIYIPLSHSLSRVSSCHSQLKVLSLYGRKLEDVTQLSSFDQMTKLKRLTIKFGSYGDESLTKFISLVNTCPCLEEFILQIIWYKPERSNRIILPSSSSSSSFKSKSLKVFEFMGYYGRVSDVELIIHVANNTVGLEKIVIDPCDVFRMEYLPHFSTTDREEESRRIAFEQFEDLRKSIPKHVHLLIR